MLGRAVARRSCNCGSVVQSVALAARQMRLRRSASWFRRAVVVPQALDAHSGVRFADLRAAVATLVVTVQWNGTSRGVAAVEGVAAIARVGPVAGLAPVGGTVVRCFAHVLRSCTFFRRAIAVVVAVVGPERLRIAREADAGRWRARSRAVPLEPPRHRDAAGASRDLRVRREQHQICAHAGEDGAADNHPDAQVLCCRSLRGRSPCPRRRSSRLDRPRDSRSRCR